jgi:hypothetical protein
VLKGAEALALLLSGPRAVYVAPGSPLARVQRLLLREPEAGRGGRSFSGPWQAPSDAVALGLCLGGALLDGEPGFAMLGPAGLLGVLGPLQSLGQLGDLRAAAVLLDGAEADPRGALHGAAPLPLLEAGGADELTPLAQLARGLSEAAGLPVALRVSGRALRERAEVRPAGLSAESLAAPGHSFHRDEGPYLTGGAAAFLAERRQARMAAVVPLLQTLVVRTPGALRKGVVLAGHLGRRAQARASGRGLQTLRLGFALPLPEAALREFCAGLQEVLVLEEGAPHLLTELQALCHREGLPARVVPAAALAARRPVRLDEAALEVELDRFAGPGRGDGPAPPYDLARFHGEGRGRLPSLRPELDGAGELDEEPWPLHLARLRRELPQFAPGEGRLRLLTDLQGLGRPVLAVTAPGPAFGPGHGRPLCDVQPPRGCVAAVAGALSQARTAEGGPPGAPLAVAFLGEESEEGEEMAGMLDNALGARDVLHVLVRERTAEGEAPRADLVGAQLQAAGMEVLRVDLDDDDLLRRALDYLAHGRGPRALLCTADRASDSQSST